MFRFGEKFCKRESCRQFDHGMLKTSLTNGIELLTASKIRWHFWMRAQRMCLSVSSEIESFHFPDVRRALLDVRSIWRRHMSVRRPRPRPATVARHVRAYAFLFDTCADGQQLKCRKVIDEYSRDRFGRTFVRRSRHANGCRAFESADDLARVPMTGEGRVRPAASDGSRP